MAAAPVMKNSFKERIIRKNLVSAQHLFKYQLSISGDAMMQDEFHPLRLKLRKRYAEREKEGLWWHVHSSLDLSAKRVVRSWCQRRLRTATKDALKLRGYDERGIKLQTANNRSDHTKNLYGTLRLLPNQAAISASYDTLQVECLRVVDTVIMRCTGKPRPDGNAKATSKSDQGEQCPSPKKVKNMSFDAWPLHRRIFPEPKGEASRQRAGEHYETSTSPAPAGAVANASF